MTLLTMSSEMPQINPSTCPESRALSLLAIPHSQASEYQLWKERSSHDLRLKHFSEVRLKVLFLRLKAEELHPSD